VAGSSASSVSWRVTARPASAATARPVGPSIANVVGQRVDVVDLTLPLEERLPCAWPGHTAFMHRIDADFSTGSSYRTATLVMDEHTGTHVDAPCHSIPEAGERTSATIPLSDLMGPAIVIDTRVATAPGAPGESPSIGADAILRAERTGGEMQTGDIVLLRTGWDAHYLPFPAGDAYAKKPVVGEQPGWLAPDESFIELLLERGVCCIGTDAPSIAALQDPGPVHVLALGNGIWPVEGLQGLAALPQRGATFLFLPMAIAGSGAPGRAIGLIPRDGAP
jgi:isatin hydrolase